MDSLTSNSKLHFAATAIVSAAVAATAVLGIQRLQQHEPPSPSRSNPVPSHEDDTLPKVH